MSICLPKNPDLVDKPGYTNYFHGVHASSFALSIVNMAREHKGLLVVLIPEAALLHSLKKEIGFFLGEESGISIETLPDWETLPYDYFSPHQDIVSERLKTLYRIPRLKHAILLLPITSALQKLPFREFVEGHSLIINKQQTINIHQLKENLNKNGYQLVNTVMQYGEYAVRGSIIDIYPTGLDSPVRIELFDDEVESLRLFDNETQITTKKIDSIELLPAREYPTDEESISFFRQSWRSTFDSNLKESNLYTDVSKGIYPAGIEYYLPLFFEKLSTIFDFIPAKKTIFVHTKALIDEATNFWVELEERYEQHRYNLDRPIVSPNALYLTFADFQASVNHFASVRLSSDPHEKHLSGFDFNFTPCPEITVEHRSADPLHHFKNQLEHFDRILICAESAGRQEVIRELLLKYHIKTTSVENWLDFQTNSSNICLTNAVIAKGFAYKKLLIIGESDLFGRQVLQARRKGNRVISPDQLIHSLAELKLGDPIVHIEQGVGRYRGLQTLDTGGIETEFLTLEYSGGGKLYVPVQSLHQIHRYSGSNPELAPWHKLGSETWSKAKRKAIEKARDTAVELLDLYARRGAEVGFKHQLDQIEYEKFAAEFPYDLTEDQKISIQAVVNDMTSTNPMDRLICGDVGFGKTEVAMRAAFVSLQNSKQVAMLVPTTLLAQQHFESFQDRFSQWPINLAVLSRFQTKKQQLKILENLKTGQVDLVIGTHRLITGNIEFKNLGLLLIDEEHRFGVRQKEVLKSYRAKVDILTLTATPIPRTLNMSMSGMRDLSIIATPPAKRLAIKTFVRQRNSPLIKEAIQREVRRGGQVFFLHNSVETIDRVAKELHELLPNIKVAVAHGQLRERELEDVMRQFYHHKFHVLVCTTIIETGIDIPTANTIIMDRADKLGLAQLHQLRGRVGRSHHQAYAYLMTPPPKTITKDAKKRLEAIAKLEDLGAGFILATHDLEIRGAGELLGDEQSGHMQTIGFSLYMELLERAIDALKKGEQPSLSDSRADKTEINLGVSALLPSDYVADVAVRLSLYKRIATAKKASSLREIQVELIDRFGLLPQQTKNLFEISQLKNQLTLVGVIKLDSNNKSFSMEFDAKPNIDTAKLIQLIQSNPSRYKLAKGTLLQVQQIALDNQQRIQQINSLIETLTV